MILRRASLGALAVLLGACGGGGTAPAASMPPVILPSPSPAPSASLSDAAALGEKIFHDVSLSASGRMSCATCHDPAHGHAQGNSLAVQLGGPNLDVPGTRAVPALRYLGFNPAFSIGADGIPRGGYNRDGRSRTLAEQAEHPLLAAHEMANGTKAAAVARLRGAAYADRFREVFGATILDDADQAFDRLAFAVQQYQSQDPDFRRFDAKYDRYVAGKATLTDAERRGLALFNDPAKGNCAACHAGTPLADGTPALFTDFSFVALGAPRNGAIAANADPAHVDLGLCGPDRTDLADRKTLCGMFKVPSLRNAAVRKVFFHNGVFASLRDAVRFHVRRDTNPEEWYPLAADGSPSKFNDLPADYRANVETRRAPFDRRPGMAPALSDAEIDDVVQFLGTLTDADLVAN